jgi:hypothetical protein
MRRAPVLLAGLFLGIEPVPGGQSVVQRRSPVMRAGGFRVVSSVLVAFVAALCMSASPAAAQSSQTRLVVFEGFYNPG